MKQGVSWAGARWRWVAWAVVLVVGAAWGAWWVAPRLVERSVVFHLRAESAGPDWSVEWTGARANGAWLFVGGWTGEPVRDGRIDADVRQRLPAYRLDTLAVRWGNPAESAPQITAARIEVKVFGWSLAKRPLAAAMDNVRAECALAGNLGTGWAVRAIGAGLVLGLSGLVGLLLMVARAMPGREMVRAVAPSVVPGLVAIAVAVGVRLWMRSWAPMQFSYDSLGYLALAKSIMVHGDFRGFDGWRPPGFPVLLAGYMKVVGDDFAGLAWIQGLMSVAIVAMVYDLARRIMAPAMAGLVAVAVAADPWLLTAETMVMTEMSAAVLVTAAVWMTIRIARAESESRRGRVAAGAMAAALGIVCGVAPLVRGNLLLLPAMVGGLLAAWGVVRRVRGEVDWRRPLAAAGAVLVIAACVVGPWVLRNAKQLGAPTVVLGRSNVVADVMINPGTALRAGGIIDPDQTAVFGRERAEMVMKRKELWQLNLVTLFTRGLAESDRIAVGELPIALKLPPAGGRTLGEGEGAKSAFMDEMAARRGPELLKIRGLAALVQLGILHEGEVRDRCAMDVESATLRGEPALTQDKSGPVRALLAQHVSPGVADNLPDLSRFKGDARTRVFAAWWGGWKVLRRIIGLLVIGAGFWALARRDWIAMAIAAVVLGNAAALGLGVMGAIDRLSLPTMPLAMVLAGWMAWVVMSRRRRGTQLPAGPP